VRSDATEAMTEEEEERVLDESPVKKSGNHGVLSSFGTSCDSVPEAELFVVLAVGDASLADFWL